jgi:hypothetical protein
MMIAIILPIIMSILVRIVIGEIQIIKGVCPPHSWSRVAMSDRLVCMICNKSTHIHPFI